MRVCVCVCVCVCVREEEESGVGRGVCRAINEYEIHPVPEFIYYRGAESDDQTVPYSLPTLIFFFFFVQSMKKKTLCLPLKQTRARKKTGNMKHSFI